MYLITFIFLTLAFAAIAVAETIRYRWAGSILEKWSKKGTPWGDFVLNWAGPEAWKNKYKLDHIPALGWALQGPLAGFTSAWHFMKLITFSALELIIALLLPDLWPGHMDTIMYFAIMKFWQGVVHILMFPNYGDERRQILEARGILMNLSKNAIQDHPRAFTALWLTICFFLAVIFHQWLNGTLGRLYTGPDDFGLAEWAGIVWIIIGWVGMYFIVSYSNKLNQQA